MLSPAFSEIITGMKAVPFADILMFSKKDTTQIKAKIVKKFQAVFLLLFL